MRGVARRAVRMGAFRVETRQRRARVTADTRGRARRSLRDGRAAVRSMAGRTPLRERAVERLPLLRMATRAGCMRSERARMGVVAARTGRMPAVGGPAFLRVA